MISLNAMIVEIGYLYIDTATQDFAQGVELNYNVNLHLKRRLCVLIQSTDMWFLLFLKTIENYLEVTEIFSIYFL